MDQELEMILFVWDATWSILFPYHRSVAIYISLHIARATDKAIFPVYLRNGLKFLKDGGNLQQENI